MKGRAFQSNRLACREREGVSVGIVVGLVLAVLVAGIPVGAEATDVATTAKSGEIPQGHIHHYPSAQGHIHHTQKPNVGRKPNHIRPVPPLVVIPQTLYFVPHQRCVVLGNWIYAWYTQINVTHE